MHRAGREDGALDPAQSPATHRNHFPFLFCKGPDIYLLKTKDSKLKKKKKDGGFGDLIFLCAYDEGCVTD